MLRAVSGTVRRTGDVVFEGTKLPRRADAAARAGIAHVPEGRGTFSELSVWENLRLGAYTRRGTIAYVTSTSDGAEPLARLLTL